MDEKKFKKGDICWIEDYQEFGECLVQLHKRIIRNIEGEVMDKPMWECYIIANNHSEFMEFYMEECVYPVHLIDIFELRLQEVSSHSSQDYKSSVS